MDVANESEPQVLKNPKVNKKAQKVSKKEKAIEESPGIDGNWREHEKIVFQPKSKTKKAKKKVKDKSPELERSTNNDSFDMDDILNNSTVYELIGDLVNCFISNYALPEDELNKIKMAFFERTCSVFVNVLNSCVRKVSNQVQGDLLKELQEKPESKDASCQTSFTDFEEGSES